MKNKFIANLIIIIFCLIISGKFVIAINEYSEEEIIRQYEERIKTDAIKKNARNVKVEIIRKNNKEIEELKIECVDAIGIATIKINRLLSQIKNKEIVLTNETIVELTQIFESLKEANSTIKNDAVKLKQIVVSEQIHGYDSIVLSTLDNVIEKQNSIIVSYKQIISKVGNI